MSTEIKPLQCWVTKNLGRYDFASTNKEWCVQVLMPDGKILSAMWDEGDEPDTDGVAPSEVVALIEARIKSYWIYTRRDEKLAQIEAVRPMFAKMDDAWARSQIATLERRIASLRYHLIEEGEEA